MEKGSLKDLLRHNKSVRENMPSMDLEPIKKLFKPEEMPDIDETPAGRIRLVRALALKHGISYRNKPGVKEALSHFDKEAGFMKMYKNLMVTKHG